MQYFHLRNKVANKKVDAKITQMPSIKELAMKEKMKLL